jgi:hypothetical protein
MIDAKERKVLNGAFSMIIGMDWRIKFVGMVDQNGKLLAGQSRSIPFSNMADNLIDTARMPIHIANSKINDLPDIFYKHKNMYLFYSDYLLWVIGKCIVNLEDLENRFDSHVTGRVREASPYFEISGCTDETVRLVITPLNVSTETFLCIYFEPAYDINNSFNDSEERFKALLDRINSNLL